jgi:hypothetical protein
MSRPILTSQHVIKEDDMKVTITLSEKAVATVDAIQRSTETFSEAIDRILRTLLPTAPDFDHFYGPPRDGKGPSGE